MSNDEQVFVPKPDKRPLYAVIAGVFVLGLILGAAFDHAHASTTATATTTTAQTVATLPSFTTTTEYTTRTSNFTDRLFTTTEAPTASDGPTYDLTITGCQPAAANAQVLGPRIDFTIINESTSTYTFDFIVSIETAGGGQQLDTVPVKIESLAPKQSNTGHVYSSRPSLTSPNIQCRAGKATATPS